MDAISHSTCPACGQPNAVDTATCTACGAPTRIAIGDKTIDQFIESWAAAPAEAVGESGHQTRLQEALGAGWQVGALIGRGGYGDVYAAWDRRLEREVAVKTIRPDVSPDAELVVRFAREAKAAAKVRHPHIIPIYAVGEADRLVYIVMARIRGESLRTFLDRQLVPITDVYRLLRETASALQAAHTAGLVHRDVKPENILLEGPERHVVLTDFGIAKALGGADTRLTRTGVVLGTPAYLSPEQIRRREIDHRADIYGLGVVAYEMCTGRLPFDDTTNAELIRHHLLTPAPDVRAYRPDAPPALAAAVMRCLAKAPTDRWQTMDEFGAALHADAITQDGASRQPSAAVATWPRRLWRYVASRRILSAIGGATAVLIVSLAWRQSLGRSSPATGSPMTNWQAGPIIDSGFDAISDTLLAAIDDSWSRDECAAAATTLIEVERLWTSYNTILNELPVRLDSWRRERDYKILTQVNLVESRFWASGCTRP